MPDLGDGMLVAPEKLDLKQPSLFQVLMLNDDFTPMHFVVEVLVRFFRMNEEQATQTMLAVHTQGQAVCGIFTKDIAETKVAQVNQYAEECDHPLLCEMQEVD
jgi:ATP-dependent Clp protease adaptor protein ClpS